MTASERRRQRRDVFTVTIDYSCEAESGKGLTTNLSDGGLGFYTYIPLNAGQGLTVVSSQLSRQPVAATVRWCSKISEHIFKVGLKFNN